jgi:hypothetical protein
MLAVIADSLGQEAFSAEWELGGRSRVDELLAEWREETNRPL